MTDARDRIERELAEAGRPVDAAKEEPLEPDPPPDRTRETVSPGLSRLRTELRWNEADEETLAIIEATATDIISTEFRAAFVIIERLRKAVRSQAFDEESGEFLTYADGTPRWEEEDGIPVEDWSRLSERERRNARHALVLYLFEWETRASDKWARAMFAKVNWEEKFAHGFTALPESPGSRKPTIDDRTQWGHRLSIDERYFAVFNTYISKKADAVVRSASRLYDLLKETSR